ncbi:hypothetical protein [Niallia sp.]|uniref:hypothetical protein n=1 Tax=Niallia sp. TaxID=2837523 RepID=UPI00289961CB|nr:hypothetical protein [Niallia sp.]
MSKYNNEDFIFEATDEENFFKVIERATGKFITYERIQGANERLISKNSDKSFKEMIEKEEYRKNGERKDPFAQATSVYENGVVGKFSAKKLDSLIRLVPKMNYNANEKENKDSVIRIKNKPALTKDLADAMGVSIRTGQDYLDEFIGADVMEEVKLSGINGKAYRFKNTAFLRGANDSDEYTKKVAFNKLQEIISKVDGEVKKAVGLERSQAAFAKKKPKFKNFYPLALLGVLLSKTHYKTFMFLKNHSDPTLVKDGEKVVDALNMKKRFRQFKFLKKYELYNMYSGLNTKSLSGTQKAELEASMKILKKLGAVGSWDSNGREIFFMNPLLVYASPNMKCDEEWKKIIFTFFNITSDDFNKVTGNEKEDE